jgi:hypothetical protein
MRYRYAVYGAGLGSDLEFPELREDAEVPLKWRFSTSAALPPMAAAEELGTECIYGDVHARLFRHAAGHRITVDDTGSFDLDAAGRQVTWEERTASWPDFVRAHLIGRVLATSMYHDGWLPLHGSAVACRDGVVAFLAPKGFGKSSLALALTGHGARLVTDDTLPVEPPGSAGGPPYAWPGVHSLRLRADSMTALGAVASSHETREGKVLLTDVPEERRASVALPLRAIYLLDPALPDGASGLPERVALPPTLAAISTVAHVKIGRMLGAGAAAPMLARAAAIVGQVPVSRLCVPRDLALLPGVAKAIIGWHGGPA